jgi:NADH-quinone oxidoreductase subunit J
MTLPVFIVLAALLVASALGVVISPHPVRSALSLVVALFVLAVVYVFLDAHLVAALQIIVYAGAIMVLFLFVIMLLNLQTDIHQAGRLGLGAAAGILGGLFVIQLVQSTRQAALAPSAVEVTAGYGTTEALAERLFSHFLLAFEMTGLLLLVATIGAVVLAKRTIK